jgi:hypothetical protein
MRDEYTLSNCQGCEIPIRGEGYLCNSCVKLHKRHLRQHQPCSTCKTVAILENAEHLLPTDIPSTVMKAEQGK